MSTLLTPNARPAGAVTWQAVAARIDHTLLRPDATRVEIEALCAQAVQHRFACAFLHPCWAPLAVSLLAGTGIPVGTPVGFPLGAAASSVKRLEAEQALRIGAREIDMVLNIGALRSGDRAFVELDIRGVAEVVHGGGGILKVTLETALLTLDEKIVACQLSVHAGADFVKSSTGFASSGATIEDIALMRGVVGETAGVKASGGIRTAADALAMLEAGASRLGTSAGPTILREMGAPGLLD